MKVIGMKMKLRTIAICALLAAAWCAGCGSVFNGAINDMTLRQTGWYTFLGGAGIDQANSVQQTSDGGYIVAGIVASNISPLQGKYPLNPYSGNSDMLVVKFDSSGNVVWYTFLGGTGGESASSVQQTSDGGYIVAGRASSAIDPLQGKNPVIAHSGSNNDMLVVKLDSSGNVAWYTFLGGAGDESASSIQQTSDGGYIVAGYASDDMTLTQGTKILNHHSSGVENDMLVVKLDSSGNISWYTFLGGADSDGASSVHQTSDGGYIVAGYGTEIPSSYMQNAPCLNNYTAGIGGDMLVVKLDSSGNVAWYTFLGGTGIEQAFSMQHTSDGGCIVAGYGSTDITLPQGTKLNAFSGGHDMLLAKLDSGGIVSWYTFLGGTGQEQAHSVEQTSDGGYIVTGLVNVAISTLMGKEPLNPFAGGSEYDMLVIKLKNDGSL